MIFPRASTVAAWLACCLVESVVFGASAAQNENCTLPEDPGPCFDSFTRYFFDIQIQECKQFTYGGCEGNANNFDTLSKCLETCKKSSTVDNDGEQVLMENSLVEAAQTSSKLDRTADRYQELLQLSSRTNNIFNEIANRLRTLAGLSQTRSRGKRNVSEVCLLTPDPGKCQEFKTMYYYDFQSMKCTTFLYGGCNGNGNKFESAGECERACKPPTPGPKNVCLLQPDIGPCRAVENKFFYNDTSKMCEEFVYGGCQGNENRFDTEKDCQDACKLPLPQRKQDVCTLSPQPGPCEARIPRYFYNSSSESCEQFIYGGCRGNKNRFRSISDCQKKCTSNVEPRNVCSLAPQTGPCKASIPRYFFNESSGACEQFIYGGCGGNGNRFETDKDCQKTCLSKDEPSGNICLLPPVTGPCKAYMPRYFYNTTSDQCEKFIYGGCQGNENRFERVEDCERKCGDSVTPVPVDRCSLEPETGPCLALFTRYFYNSTSGNCEPFTYGGCEGNENRFETVEDCKRNCSRDITPPPVDRCLLAPETGPCLALIPRFFYNSTSGQCEVFTYGGCGGNKNRFETELECQQQCSRGITEGPRDNEDVCKLPAESGPCLAYFPKYHFNTTSGKCELFIFGGCGGNKNRFDTEVDCEKRCSGQPETPVPFDRCFLEPETGPCLALFPRYFYNSTSGSCEPFTYGGCQGNENRFETLEDCDRNCGDSVTPVSVDRCFLEPETGPCLALFPRYFHNSTSGNCEPFTYGGCEGNENRFETVEECERNCNSYTTPSSVDRCSLPPETGPCRARIPRYFHNATSNQCEKFIYGGCLGNENRFKTVEDCQRNCSTTFPTTQPINVCLLPPETGRCDAFIPRYFYNATSAQCEKFIYGGCGGNGNRFEKESQCLEICGVFA